MNFLVFTLTCLFSLTAIASDPIPQTTRVNVGDTITYSWFSNSKEEGIAVAKVLNVYGAEYDTETKFLTTLQYTYFDVDGRQVHQDRFDSKVFKDEVVLNCRDTQKENLTIKAGTFETCKTGSLSSAGIQVFNFAKIPLGVARQQFGSSIFTFVKYEAYKEE